MHLFDEIGEASNVVPWLDHPNLDYPSGPAYHLMGFDTPTFTALFVASRVTGWTAHIIEQAASNALIRPLSAYHGVDERHVPVVVGRPVPPERTRGGVIDAEQ